MQKNSTCKVSGCSNKVRTRGFCSNHYNRWLKYGDPLWKAPRKEHPRCSIPGCGKLTNSHGLCSAHENRMRRYGDPLGQPVVNKRTGITKHYPKEYVCYRSMKNRCLNPNNDNYTYYGNRGIKICDRWLGPDGFKNFLEDMGPKPSYKTTSNGLSIWSIDRVNPDEDYSPGNCRWATWTQQNKNRRSWKKKSP